MSYLRERDIERMLVRAVRKAGGICPKFVSPGWDGAPDRLILLPEGRIAFAELKAPGQKLRPLQESRMRKLESLGYDVYIIDDPVQVEAVILRMQKGGAAE